MGGSSNILRSPHYCKILSVRGWKKDCCQTVFDKRMFDYVKVWFFRDSFSFLTVIFLVLGFWVLGLGFFFLD